MNPYQTGEKEPNSYFYMTEDQKKALEGLPKRIETPFTPAQVQALNEYQTIGHFHPFTCGTDSRHGGGALVATEAGWICPDCDYTQNWAHGFMVDGPR